MSKCNPPSYSVRILSQNITLCKQWSSCLLSFLLKNHWVRHIQMYRDRAGHTISSHTTSPSAKAGTTGPAPSRSRLFGGHHHCFRLAGVFEGHALLPINSSLIDKNIWHLTTCYLPGLASLTNNNIYRRVDPFGWRMSTPIRTRGATFFRLFCLLTQRQCRGRGRVS